MGDIESELEKRKEMRQLSITLIIMSALLLIGDGILLEFHNQMPSKEETVRIQFRDSTIGMINWLLVSAVMFCFFQYGANSLDWDTRNLIGNLDKLSRDLLPL